MDLKSLPLFPIPISVCNFGKELHNLNVSLVEDAVQEKDKDPNGEDHSNFGGWHSKPNLETKYESYSELSSILTKYGNIYCKQHGYKDVMKTAISTILLRTQLRQELGTIMMVEH